jgi:protein-S-isoprenylcysteine O-methyltransferase Ste14
LALDDKSKKKILPPVYFLVAIVLAVLLHFFLPLQQMWLFPWRLTGAIPFVIGVAVALSADRLFRAHGTTVKPFEQSSALVTAGVFSVSRNPMYLGMTLILFGIVVFLGSLAPFVVVIALPILLDRLFIAEEERMLEEVFGERFQEYRNRVRRWI